MDNNIKTLVSTVTEIIASIIAFPKISTSSKFEMSDENRAVFYDFLKRELIKKERIEIFNLLKENPSDKLCRIDFEYSFYELLEQNIDLVKKIEFYLDDLLPNYMDKKRRESSTSITTHRGSGDNIGSDKVGGDIIIRGSGDSNVNINK